MNKVFKEFLIIIADILIVMLSLIVAFGLRYDNLLQWFSGNYDNIRIPIIFIFAFSAVFSNTLLNCYDNVWKMAGIVEATRQLTASIVSIIINFGLIYLFDLFGSERLFSNTISPSVVFIAVLIQFLLMSFLRFTYRITSESLLNFIRTFSKGKKVKVIIYGNIESSKLIIEKLRNDKSHNKVVVAIIDEELPLGHGSSVCGVRIFNGSLDTLRRKIDSLNIDEVIVSNNNLCKNTLLSIFQICKDANCAMKVFRGIEDYKLGKNYLSEINIEDLLGRTPTQLDINEIKKFIFGKTIMVTGGAGSIGSEICRQALKYECKKLIIFDFCENSLFELENELLEHFEKSKIKVVIGSVRDIKRLKDVYSKYRPDIVFHAAAHKHVPLMEANPVEAIKNNIYGTYNVAKLAVDYKVEDFILISTDKAVNPTNVMGTTKRIAEMIIQYFNTKSTYTKLAAVRFGNVLGSNGSVIPIFKKQIEKGGPVTVTHPEIKRYFMTISEAVQLVMRAGSMANGGEVFILDMGEPVKIYDLAKDIIRLSGYEPEKDIKITFTGLRPGEKMFEELRYDNESARKTSNNKIYICNSTQIDKNFKAKLARLESIIKSEVDADYRIALKDIVSEYNYSINTENSDIDIIKEDSTVTAIADTINVSEYA